MSVKSLLERTLLASFKISPPPATLTQSLAVRTHLASLIGDRGRIVHYRQGMCPVTKQRLDSLRVLIEDFERDKKQEPVALFTVGKTVAANLTDLETELLGLRIEAGVPDTPQTLKLTAASRDPAQIEKLKYLD